MMRFGYLILVCIGFLCGCMPSNSSRQLNIVASPPPGLSPDDSVHMVGTFNQWSLEGDKASLMTWDSGKLVASIPLSDEPLLINFVKNKDWSNMAATQTGKSTCGYFYDGADTDHSLQVTIDGWMGEPARQQVQSTLTGDIRFFPAFDMPQLSRKGDIAVFLPPSYTATDEKRYPVLYMLDGQNIFDESTSYSNEWQIDEALSDMFAHQQLKELIVVAVPNGPRRWQEYNPWDYLDNQNASQVGEGPRTLAFIKQTLKPFIDGKFRTRPETQNTGLAGSSLGGMMAIYAALAHGETFGFVAAFSPSLGVQNLQGKPALLNGVIENKTVSSSRFYLDMGKIEYTGYEPFENLHQALLDVGIPDEQIKVVKDDKGRHCELDWARRFPAAIKWLINH